jgi:hypothetical protein
MKVITVSKYSCMKVITVSKYSCMKVITVSKYFKIIKNNEK